MQRGPGASWQHSVKNEGLLFPGQASPTKKLSKCLEMTPSRCVLFSRHRSLFQEALDVHPISLYILYQLYFNFSLSILSRKSCSCRSAETWHKVFIHMQYVIPNCGELTQSRNDGKRHSIPRKIGNSDMRDSPSHSPSCCNCYMEKNKMKVLLLNLVCSPCFWVSPLALRSERCQDCPNHKKQPVLRSKSRVQ